MEISKKEVALHIVGNWCVCGGVHLCGETFVWNMIGQPVLLPLEASL